MEGYLLELVLQHRAMAFFITKLHNKKKEKWK
jgi:hypothetical protein